MAPVPGPTSADVLACLLLHAAGAGPNGRLVPTEPEIAAMLQRPPPRWMEARALATAFVADLRRREPPALKEAAVDFAGALLDLSERYGGLLSAPFPGKKAGR